MGRAEVERFGGVARGLMDLLRLWKCVEKWRDALSRKARGLEVRILKVQGASNSSHQFLLVSTQELMLPNTHNPPTSLSKRACDQEIARSVLKEFCRPKRFVACGFAFVLWAAVPKASVYKDRNATSGKYEIRLTKYPSPTTPATKPIASK
jgi:hypothetical protein